MKFKMFKLTKIAEYINILSAIIFFVIVVLSVFGCKLNRQEGFENNKRENFQNEIVDQVKSGKIDVQLIEQYIKEKKLTKEDLDAIIKAVETTDKK